MIIDCISDLHGWMPFYPGLQGGDLLIVAGDLTRMDTHDEHEAFKEWLLVQPYKRKILIAGNHDGHIEKGELPRYDDGIDYLQDSGTEFEGLKIWGSPWTPTFCNWHFMLPRGAPIRAKWDLIPEDTDILVTHGPPYGILDMCSGSRGNQFKHAGCADLREAVERIQPRLYVFGHIHEQGGKQIVLKTPGRDILCVNACIMDECYNPIHKPIRVIL